MVGRPMKDPNAVTHYSLNRQQYLDYMKNRRNTPGYIEKQRVYQRKYYEKNREVLLARQRVGTIREKKVKPIVVKEVKEKKEKRVKKSEIKFYVPEENPTFKEVPMSFTENDWA
jgi:DUF4097 and DUF4098 domain-containing protein YvlB